MARMPFATFLIICPTSFFLGILFTNLPYDFHTLWSRLEPTERTLLAIESHYTQLYLSPPLVTRLLHTLIATGLLAFLSKLYKPSESNLLFDGASLVLYVVGLVMYLTNVLQGLEIVHAGVYGKEVGRVDSLRVIAASQTILALVLVGVLALQAGQWYAEAKEREEIKGIEEKERLEREREEKAKGGKAQ